ncbi:MAG: AzlC family ABC transporter permease [Chloroflexota bacterium]|jgi:4-azaleucine resistance transporter AzlC
MSTNAARSQFYAGVKAEMPILLGVVPFGLIYGILALEAGLSSLQAQAMSMIVFAGSAQFVMAQLFALGTPASVIVITAILVNLRHALYSASIAPYVKHLPGRWRFSLAYLLTDEAYAVTINHYRRDDRPVDKPWFFLGAGLALWTTWQISTAAGILLGAQIPAAWPLAFFLPLTFIALAVPGLQDWASAAAALIAGLVSVLAFDLPFRLGLVVAALAGVSAGMLVERVGRGQWLVDSGRWLANGDQEVDGADPQSPLTDSSEGDLS